jgi:hypothetical protein
VRGLEKMSRDIFLNFGTTFFYFDLIFGRKNWNLRTNQNVKLQRGGGSAPVSPSDTWVRTEKGSTIDQKSVTYYLNGPWASAGEGKRGLLALLGRPK